MLGADLPGWDNAQGRGELPTTALLLKPLLGVAEHWQKGLDTHVMPLLLPSSGDRVL